MNAIPDAWHATASVVLKAVLDRSTVQVVFCRWDATDVAVLLGENDRFSGNVVVARIDALSYWQGGGLAVFVRIGPGTKCVTYLRREKPRQKPLVSVLTLD